MIHYSTHSSIDNTRISLIVKRHIVHWYLLVMAAQSTYSTFSVLDRLRGLVYKGFDWKVEAWWFDPSASPFHLTLIFSSVLWACLHQSHFTMLRMIIFKNMDNQKLILWSLIEDHDPWCICYCCKSWPRTSPWHCSPCETQHSSHLAYDEGGFESQHGTNNKQ